MQHKTVNIVSLIGSKGCAWSGVEWLRTALDAADIGHSDLQYWNAEEKQLYIVAGLSEHQYIARILKEHDIQLPGEESLAILNISEGNAQLVVAVGGGHTGLMYALGEIADCVQAGGYDALLNMQDQVETPDLLIRGTDRFLMSERDDGWFYSEEFWNYHIQRLARSRFNRFTLIVGFDTAYMSPPYPFFMEIAGFKQVTVAPRLMERRARTLGILNHIGTLCHDMGIEFIFSTWQQLPWTDNQQSMVEGLPKDDDEFTRYCATGIRELLEACPSIDGVQFRVNLEAGITAKGGKGATHNQFWFKMIDAVAAVKRHLKIDIRAKGMTDALLAHAMESGLEALVATKYWCEHMAEPYQMTSLRTEEWQHLGNENSTRRYSYDNLLKRPHTYGMLYRLWTYGSANLFLWGDPDYVRRFSASCEEFAGLGFTISEPLSMKGGHALLPGGDFPIHADPGMQAYRWEDERYWMYYLLFGRIGYRRETSAAVWQRELKRRYGVSAQAIGTAYQLASRVMPLITTAHFPVHPSMHYWPELYSGAALFADNNFDEYFGQVDYAGALPSDEQLFSSVRNAVKADLSGTSEEKYHPLTVREWYWKLAEQIDGALEAARTQGAEQYADWTGISVDFRMIAGIARYHAQMIAAAWYLERYRNANSVNELPKSWNALLRARQHWSGVSALGDRYYARNLMFDAGTGRRRNGNWHDRLDRQINPDVACLKALLQENGLAADEVITADDEMDVMNPLRPMYEEGNIQCSVPTCAKAGQSIHVSVRIGGVLQAQSVHLYYRHVNQREEYQMVELSHTGDCWSGAINADYVEAQWDIMAYLAVCDAAGAVRILPGLRSPDSPMPYCIIQVRE